MLNGEEMIINSIFNSINGEITSLFQGSLSTFIRLQGCNLKCSYCDTQYAWESKEGKEMSIDEIIKEIEKLKCKNITITGGEPLLQKDELSKLTLKLLYKRYRITVETNGSQYLNRRNFLLGNWDNQSLVVDYKLPSSKQESKMSYSLFSELEERDWVKFVILDRQDFIYSVNVRKKLEKGGCKARFAYSPVFTNAIYSQPLATRLNPNILLDWLKEYDLYDSCINLQLHKLINLKE